MTRTVVERLEDIGDAIMRIEAVLRNLDKIPNSREAELLQDAILYRLLVIGEAASTSWAFME